MSDLRKDADSLMAWKPLMDAYLASLPVTPKPVNLPRHRFGVHLIGNREADLRYIEQLRPPAVKIVDPDPAVVRRVLNAIDPNGIVVLRDHPLSEQKADMARDPVSTGKRHALDWTQKLATGRFKEFGGDKRIVVCGINEPDVHNETEERIVFEYTKAFLTELTYFGIRALALNLSVGWPRNTGENKPLIWDTFLPLEDIINRGNHFLCTHEYWYPTPQQGWGWYGNRIAACPMTVPIIIGECGYTRQLIRMDIPQPWGWVGNMAPQQYAEQLWYYHDKVEPNVFAIMPFTTGFASSEWESKDTQPAHADILARVRSYNWPSPWPVPEETTPTQPEPQPESNPMLVIVPRYTGRITGYYGSLYKSASGVTYAHEGLDIGVAEGYPIGAPFDGVVAWSDYEADTYGHYIRVSGPHKADFFYGHLKQRLVQTGNSVKQGQIIGYSGNTGNSSGPHIHFEIRLKTVSGQYQTGVSAKTNARVDPLAWLAGWTAAGNKVEER